MREFTKDDIQNIAKQIIKKIDGFSTSVGATIVAFSGDLGAGKTTTIQEIARELGVTETVTSPTFVILKSYKLKAGSYKLLIHIDAYRLRSANELRKLGWDEMAADPKNLVFIEWPEQVAELIPKHAIKISLAHKDEKTRRVSIS